MKIITVLVLLASGIMSSITGLAQAPQVPHKMQFAGITLTIRDDARREIQKDVDAYTLSPKHFNIKVERAKTYFPLIEKIFAEENVPVDFKYLVLQESALIPDAVSTSNAVGFWQFKDFTAIEMGLRVDRHIDERMNIASASRGAARYIKKNNTFFNNWIYALQAYQMGAGAVMQTVKDTQGGATHMEITSKTYWYVKKFLAHKIAYEDAVTGVPQLKVITYENKTKKSLSELAREVAVDEAILKDYNKWVKSGTIPEDKTYIVVIPLAGNDPKLLASTLPGAGVIGAAGAAATIPLTATKVGIVKINGLRTIIALQNENATKLAARGDVDLSDFLKWNDISISDPIKPGQHYFLAQKRTRATEAYHKVLPGETLWTISQDFGVRLKKLQRFNRMDDTHVTVGETLYLKAKRPRELEAVTASDQQIAEVDNKDVFNWTADPKEVTVATDSAIATTVVPPRIVIEPEIKQEVTDTVKTLQPLTPEILVVEQPKKDSVITVSIKNTEHVVQAGETLYGIAKQHNLQVMNLVEWNELDLQTGIKPGQVLKLAESQVVNNEEVTSNEPSELIYEVKASDTLYGVARKYGVTIKELMDWNQKKDFSVTLGEKLKIIKK